ncbi:14-3-3 protein gamma-like [Teleopsis dalmanni]|uniref:14-3-3 protein gamma-like n=1 Tax=Teleopsis dalmanni TaxID=139649 RepID=UPI0018CCB2EC|nr:14-3-3 protein gamma-like [Teleopsis dalmanni]
MTSTNTNQKAVASAKIRVANLTKSYEEMVAAVKELVECQPQLNDQEINWLSIAYKHSVNIRRDSWRTIKQKLDQEKAAGHTKNVEKAQKLLKQIEKEMRFYCTDILQMLEEKILPNVKDESALALCFKLVGDHNRFLAEFETDRAQIQAIENGLKAYEESYKLAKKLNSTSPVFLAIVLNYSLFATEIAKDTQLAINMIISARNAITEYDILSRETLVILKCLDENVRQWAATKDWQ